MIQAQHFLNELNLAIIKTKINGNIDLRNSNIEELEKQIHENAYIEFINQKALNIYSIPNKESVLEKHFSVLWRGNKDESRKRIKLMIEYGYQWKKIQTIITIANEKRYIESELISEIEDHILKYVWITLKDITEIVLESKEILKREERYRFFIETNQTSVFRYEFLKPFPLNLPFNEAVEFILTNIYLAECNKAYSLDYGIENPENLKGWTLYQTFPEPVGNARKMAETYVKRIHWSNLETHYILPTGSKYFLTSVKSKITNNYVEAVWGSRIDITKMKLAEKALEEIAWHQSHSVRKPVANILGLANLIEKDSERYEEYLELLIGSTKKLDGIIAEIVGMTYDYEKEFGEIDRNQNTHLE